MIRRGLRLYGPGQRRKSVWPNGCAQGTLCVPATCESNKEAPHTMGVWGARGITGEDSG